MRKIAEVAEDIKSILNNIEKSEECNGETLVDINELVDEILSINSENMRTKHERDIISEYVKINRPEILNSIDFIIFKVGSICSEYVKQIVETYKTIDIEKLIQAAEQLEKDAGAAQEQEGEA